MMEQWGNGTVNKLDKYAERYHELIWMRDIGRVVVVVVVFIKEVFCEGTEPLSTSDRHMELHRS